MLLCQLSKDVFFLFFEFWNFIYLSNMALKMTSLFWWQLKIVRFAGGHFACCQIFLWTPPPIVRFIGLLSKVRNEYSIGRGVHQQIWQEAKCPPTNLTIFRVHQQREVIFGVLWQILPKQICMFTLLLLLIRQVFMLHTWLLINKMHKRLYCTLVILFSKYKYVRLEEPGNTFSNLTRSNQGNNCFSYFFHI